MVAPRAHWGSRVGFILAAAGSAVGLGNIWKFPYVTGENGGGVFILAYAICVVLIGLPVMTAEILIGRATQKSPVSALRSLTHRGNFWVSFGWLGVFAAASLLSYYAVVAGWALHYTFLAVTGELAATPAAEIGGLFGALNQSGGLSVTWHLVFMAMTVGVVVGGVSSGVERWARILMPALFAMMLLLIIDAAFLPGFREGIDFAFGVRPEDFSWQSVLAALGQAFFSLSVGMGTMLTYGSYLRKTDDIMGGAVQISILDTGVALMASMVIFPIIFSFGIGPGEGPGLLFVSVPTAMSQMPFATPLMSVFFLLLVFAALTSSISLLEVPVSFLIDELGWGRRKATAIAGAAIAAYGIPSALSGSTSLFGGWFNGLDYLVSNFMFPLGGIGIALFAGWRMNEALRHDHFLSGSRYAFFYNAWLVLLRFVVPVGITIVLLNALEII